MHGRPGGGIVRAAPSRGARGYANGDAIARAGRGDVRVRATDRGGIGGSTISRSEGIVAGRHDVGQAIEWAGLNCWSHPKTAEILELRNAAYVDCNARL